MAARKGQLIPMDESTRQALDSSLTRYPGFPRPPIVFVDIFPLFRNPQLLSTTVEVLASAARSLMSAVPDGTRVSIAGLESRGFLHGVPLAMALEVPFVGIRKAGKCECIRAVRAVYLQRTECFRGLYPRTTAIAPSRRLSEPIKLA